jgi:hypothetical protein
MDRFLSVLYKIKTHVGLKVILVPTLILFFQMSLSCSDVDFNISELEGVWGEENPSSIGIYTKFIWGYSSYNPYTDVVFEYKKHKLTRIILPDYNLKVKGTNIQGNNVIINLETKERVKEITLSFLSKDKIQIINDNFYFPATELVKLGGPGTEFNDYFIPSITDAKLFVDQNIDSEVIKILKPQDILVVIDYGDMATINDIEGNWLKVKCINTGVEGWCFSADISKREK